MSETSSPEVLIAREAIARRVDELAAAIEADYGPRQPLVLVGVLKGAFIFLADLSRSLAIPHRIEFVALSSYRGAVMEPGEMCLRLDVGGPIRGHHVLVVEDIVDTAQTWSFLRQLLGRREPASLRLCSLLRKPARQREPLVVDYLGFDVPDVWVVGYGLDYAEQYRSLPYVGILDVGPSGARDCTVNPG